MIGLRGAMFASKRGGWTNPYVTDGLVAMWDGEWNAGGGVHDASATVWKDLSQTGCDLDINPLATIRDNYITAKDVADKIFVARNGSKQWFTWEDIATVEIVCKMPIDGTGLSSDWGTYFLALDGDTSVDYCCRGFSWVRYTNNVSFGTQMNGVGPGTTNPINKILSFSATYSEKQYVSSISRNGIVMSETSYKSNLLDIGVTIGGGSNCNQTETYCVRAYSRALTADEIASNYAVDKARFNLS